MVAILASQMQKQRLADSLYKTALSEWAGFSWLRIPLVLNSKVATV